MPQIIRSKIDGIPPSTSHNCLSKGTLLYSPPSSINTYVLVILYYWGRIKRLAATLKLTELWSLELKGGSTLRPNADRLNGWLINTRSTRLLPRVGLLTACIKPFVTAKLYSWTPKWLLGVQKSTQLMSGQLKSPTTMVGPLKFKSHSKQLKTLDI